MRFFFYGTLLDPDVRDAVLGRPIGVCRPAHLDGWRCVFVDGDTYPVIVPRPGGRVEGVLTPPLDLSAVRLLRTYEGTGYVEKRLPVIEAEGPAIQALAFVPRLRDSASDRPWCLAAWQARHKRTSIVRHGLARAATRGRGGRASGDPPAHT